MADGPGESSAIFYSIALLMNFIKGCIVLNVSVTRPERFLSFNPASVTGRVTIQLFSFI
jgi:hypothetical protein